MKKILLLFAALLCLTGYSQTTIKDYYQSCNRETGSYQNQIPQTKKVLFNHNEYLQTPIQKKQTTTNLPSKSSKTIKQCLDSIVTTTYKEFFSYDEKGNQTLYKNCSWDEYYNKWQDNYKKELTYDNAGNITKIDYYYLNYDTYELVLAVQEEFEWDNHKNKTTEIIKFFENGAIVSGSKVEYDYDEYKNQINNFRYMWENNEWIKLYHGESTYFVHGKLKNYIDYEWAENDWEPYYKIEHSYDENLNNIQSIIYEWVDNDWKNSSKCETKWDDHGNYFSVIIYIWIDDDWVIDNMSIEKYEYTYDETGKIVMLITHWWDWEEDVLLPQMKDIYTYYPTGAISTSESYYNSKTTGNWAGSSKYGYEYDEAQYLSVLIFSNWNEENENWSLNSKDEYEYDDAGNQIVTTSYYRENDLWVKSNQYEDIYDLMYSKAYLVIPSDLYMEYKKLEHRDKYWDGTDWIQNGLTLYFWSERDIVSVADITGRNNTVFIYPNPASTEVHVILATQNEATYNIFNSVGQRIKYDNIQNGASINIQSLSPGIYFLNILGETLKVIKQ